MQYLCPDLQQGAVAVPASAALMISDTDTASPLPRPAHCLPSPHYVMSGEMWEQCCGDTTPLENSNIFSREQLPGSINETSEHGGSEEVSYNTHCIVIVWTRRDNNPS